MLEGVDFSYAGIKSVDMGVYNVQLSSGMFDEPFLSERQIIETKIPGRDKPYFHRVEYSPLTFTLSFAFKYKYDEKKIREVARWLNQEYYQPFFTIDNPNRIFYCMPVGDTRLIHNGLKQGYIRLEMRCNSPYSYSPQYAKENIDFALEETRTVHEDDFTDIGTKHHLTVENGALKLERLSIKWSDFEGMTWRDFIE